MTIANKRDRTRFGRLILGLALTGILPVVATPGWAQTIKETQPFTATVQNPCVPEDVPVEGVIAIHETTRVRGDGTLQFIASDRIQATGVGFNTGVDYNYGDELKINIIFDPDGGPILIRTRARVLSDGPTDNFHVTSVFKVSGDGQKTTTKFEEECRG